MYKKVLNVTFMLIPGHSNSAKTKCKFFDWWSHLKASHSLREASVACEALLRETTYHITSNTTAFLHRLRLSRRTDSAMASEEPQAKKQKLSEEKTDAPAKLR